MSKDFRTTLHDFVAEGDEVVVLTTRELAGRASEGADVLTFNEDGKLVTFEALGDTAKWTGSSRSRRTPRRIPCPRAACFGRLSACGIR